MTTNTLLSRRCFFRSLSAMAGALSAAERSKKDMLVRSVRPEASPTPRLRVTPPEGLRFLTVPGLAALFDFPPDMARVAAEPNRLSNQVLVQTFEEEWGAVHR